MNPQTHRLLQSPLETTRGQEQDVTPPECSEMPQRTQAWTSHQPGCPC